MELGIYSFAEVDPEFAAEIGSGLGIVLANGKRRLPKGVAAVKGASVFSGMRIF